VYLLIKNEVGTRDFEKISIIENSLLNIPDI
jgi:hypothetical protein